MLDICVTVLCGIPGSGKSTFAKSLIDKCTMASQDNLDEPLHWLLVSYDAIIPTDVEKNIIEREMPNAWKECRENIHNAVDNLVRELKNETETSGTFTTGTENKDCHFESFQMFLQNMRHKESGRVVILIDDNMYYSSMRYKYYQLTRKYSISFCQVHIDCDTETALIRNRERLKGLVPDDVILNMAARFEVPNPEQNVWEKHSISVNTNSSPKALENSMIQTMELITRALSAPSQPVLEDVDQTSRVVDRQICSENMIHQADLLMRKLTAEYMKEASRNTRSKDHMRTLSTCLSDSKSDILQKMKKGVVYFHSLEDLINRLQDIFRDKIVAAGYGDFTC